MNGYGVVSTVIPFQPLTCGLDMIHDDILRYSPYMRCRFFLSLSQLSVLSLADGVDGVAMSHRLSKEELDEQFELFLKEVMSRCVQSWIITPFIHL